MKKILLLLISFILLLSLVACNDGDGTNNSGGDPSGTSSTVLNEAEWDQMISDDMLANYTVIMEGNMSVTTNGKEEGTSDVKQKTKVANDKLSMEIFAGDQSVDTMVIDGDLAKAQMTQTSQLFKTLMAEYDNFTYDADKKIYKVTESVTIDTVLKGFGYQDEGAVREFDVPTVIVMRDAEITVSEDGKLVSFVCDYSQSMTMTDGDEVVTSGVVTWSFSDFGTTVIEEN
ncbi:MAG: hypothetical protein J6Q78_04775 [Clostridia bacterium]|nr:hypothetical protein [Clostridia bacterium]